MSTSLKKNKALDIDVMNPRKALIHHNMQMMKQFPNEESLCSTPMYRCESCEMFFPQDERFERHTVAEFQKTHFHMHSELCTHGDWNLHHAIHTQETQNNSN